MEGVKEISVSPLVHHHAFCDGDLVHVFEGTGVGKVDNRSVGWFGRVVGREGNTYMVRNRILSARGSPTRVEGQYMKLQTDFTIGSVSEERVHFRTLSKRTRARIMASADMHNKGRLEDAEKALVEVKKQKTEDVKAHILRREQISQQGAEAMQQTKTEYELKVGYRKAKSNRIAIEKKSLSEEHKSTVKKTQVFVYVYSLSITFVLCLYLY